MTPRVAGLGGCWRRSLIVYSDGRRDVATRVQWLQGMSLFVDLRQPETMLEHAHVTRLDDLSMADCARLARQEGFAGRFGFDGSHFEWVRLIDYQPRSGAADAGSLAWEGDILVERGRDIDYTEHWHRDDAARVPAAAACLQDIYSGRVAIVVRVGDAFMFARDRPLPVQRHTTLVECILGAPTLAHARLLIDCEISAGIVHQDYCIRASTLPFRRGRALGMSRDRDRITTRDIGADGAPLTRFWNITASEGDLGVL